jgi:hypothetical protein
MSLCFQVEQSFLSSYTTWSIKNIWPLLPGSFLTSATPADLAGFWLLLLIPICFPFTGWCAQGPVLSLFSTCNTFSWWSRSLPWLLTLFYIYVLLGPLLWSPHSYMQWPTYASTPGCVLGVSKFTWPKPSSWYPIQFFLLVPISFFQLLKSKSLVLSLSPLSQHTTYTYLTLTCHQILSDIPSKCAHNWPFTTLPCYAPGQSPLSLTWVTVMAVYQSPLLPLTYYGLFLAQQPSWFFSNMSGRIIPLLKTLQCLH